MLTKNSSSVFGVVTTLRTGRYKSITDSNKSDRFVYSPNREDRPASFSVTAGGSFTGL